MGRGVREIRFRVDGLPISKGSKTAGVTKDGKVFMREAAAAALTPWMRTIRTEATKHRVTWMRQSPLEVRMAFTFPMRKGEMTASWKATKPDLDKLERAVLDALTQGKVLVDDAQVVATHSTKVHGRRPGVSVCVRDATNIERPLVIDEIEMALLTLRAVAAGEITPEEGLFELRSL